MRPVDNQVAIAEHLVNALQQARQENERNHLYILIDPCLRNALDDENFAQAMAHTQATTHPILWQHAYLRQDHRPLLIPVEPSNNAGSELLAHSIAQCLADVEALSQGTGQRICGWLLSDQSVPALQVHLGAVAVQPLPFEHRAELGRRRLLRYFDPMVMPVVWSVLDDIQRTDLLGPVAQWFWVDACGSGKSKLREVGRPGVASPAPSYKPWSRAQWHVLMALDAVNPALISSGMTTEKFQQRQKYLECLIRLLQIGLRHPTDLSRLAILALRWHHAFDRHPRVARLLANRGESHGSAALAPLSQADWAAIRDELNKNVQAQTSHLRW